VWGLAGLLKLDVETLRDATYDQTPVRDPLFMGIATNRVGPGRSLRDSAGNLHVLVPADDPYLARTVGMVLDDYRKDTGADPGRVLLYRYQIDADARQIHLEPEPGRPASAIREQYGYREMRIDDLSALQRFLSQTQQLSRLEARSGELWAAGWNWPGVPAGQ